MKRLIWSQPARRDLIDIIIYYRAINDELARDISRRVMACPDMLLTNPGIGTALVDGNRKWRVKATPFLLIYTHNATEVEIRRVIHQSSDWKPE